MAGLLEVKEVSMSAPRNWRSEEVNSPNARVRRLKTKVETGQVKKPIAPTRECGAPKRKCGVPTESKVRRPHRIEGAASPQNRRCGAPPNVRSTNRMPTKDAQTVNVKDMVHEGEMTRDFRE